MASVVWLQKDDAKNRSNRQLENPCGTRSGPEALAVMKLLRRFTIHGRVKSISGMDGTYWPSIFGKSPVFSLVDREMYWELKASSTSAGSLTN